MTQFNFQPVNSRHTYVNLFRPIYGKSLPDPYQVQLTGDESEKDFQKDIDISFDTYLECHNDYKNGKMTEEEDRYRLYGIPGPSQYKAFSEFFEFFSGEELDFLKKQIFYYHDITKMDELQTIGMLEFIDNLTKFDFSGKELEVVYCSGSFWRKKPDIRKKIISKIKLLEKKGVKVQIFTNARKTERHMYKIWHLVKKTGSRFNLENRIPIHYIKYGDYYFIEFPHTEKIITRLNMFVDLNDFNYKLNKSKVDVVQFFDKLIERAL